MDELVRIIGMDTGRLSGLLLQLEIKGLIIQTEGKYFQLLSDIN
jgi:predicted Rossmann fold nucleotide-binding protein DprA/Smf involved in DNA uptake